MLKMFFYRWREALVWMLLGAASICFSGMTPLPPILHLPPFPGGTLVALESGSVCLSGSGLCLLLGWWQARRDTQQISDKACARVTERQALLATSREETLKDAPDLLSAEELEGIPLWFLRALHDHRVAGHEDAARCWLAEWRVSPLKKRTHGQNPALYACHICGLPDIPTLLFICAHCQQLAHGHCSTLARRVQEEGSTLTVDPKVRPFCHSCLEMLQTQGWKLTQDEDGWLLMRQNASPQ